MYNFIYLFIIFNITQQDFNFISCSTILRINKLVNIKK